MRFQLAKLVIGAAALAGCSEPQRKLVGKAISPDGKMALALYHEVPGSIIDDRLVLTIATPTAEYSADDSVAGISVASHLRAYWTPDGRPALLARSLEGWVNSEGPNPLRVCIGAANDCANLDLPLRKIEVQNYRSAESG